MKKLFLFFLLLPLIGFQTFSADQSSSNIRVLLVTGGHDYETNAFLQMFREFPGVTLVPVTHPKAQASFAASEASNYDVMLFYDMWADISPEARENLKARLKEGKGLVALHHSLGNYQNWPEYIDIIGGKYHLKERLVNGARKPGSTYKHDVKFKITVTDPSHPITRGLSDFEIHDETYGNLEIRPEAKILLTTDEPTSNKEVAWTHSYAGARVATIQLGHDHFAWENPNFKRLLSQAIQWTAPK